MIDKETPMGYIAQKYFEPIKDASLQIFEGLGRTPKHLRVPRRIEAKYSTQIKTIETNSRELMAYIEPRIPEVVRMPDNHQ